MAYRAKPAESLSCPFCSSTANAEIISRSRKYFPSQFSRSPTQLQYLAQRELIQVRPDVYPAADGIPHYLITTAEHYLALAHMARELIPDFTWAVKEVQSRLGVCLMAEHGTGINQKVMGKSIGHAHGHFFPAQPGLAEFLDKRLRSMKELSGVRIVSRTLQDVADLPTYVSDVVEENPYLLLHDFSKQVITLYIEEGDVRVPSQLIKRLLADFKNQPFINWKEMSPEETKAMALRLYATLNLWETEH